MRKYLILLVALFASCRTNNFVGTFSSRVSPYRFILDSDSTFKYHYKEGFLYGYSSGHWSKIGKLKIKLQSFYKDRAMQLNGSENISSDFNKNVELKIQIAIPNEEKNYYRCLIYINQKFFLAKGCDSISSIMAPGPIKNILLKITTDNRIPMRDNDTLITSEYYPKHDYLKSITLNCTYIDSLFNYKVFNGYVLNFSKGNIKYMKYKLFRNLRYKP
jgi:hypothetical protein